MTTKTKTIVTLRAEYTNAVEAYFAAAKAHAALDCYKVNPLATALENMVAAKRAVDAAEVETCYYVMSQD